MAISFKRINMGTNSIESRALEIKPETKAMIAAKFGYKPYSEEVSDKANYHKVEKWLDNIGPKNILVRVKAIDVAKSELMKAAANAGFFTATDDGRCFFALPEDHKTIFTVGKQLWKAETAGEYSYMTWTEVQEYMDNHDISADKKQTLVDAMNNWLTKFWPSRQVFELFVKDGYTIVTDGKSLEEAKFRQWFMLDMEKFKEIKNVLRDDGITVRNYMNTTEMECVSDRSLMDDRTIESEDLNQRKKEYNEWLSNLSNDDYCQVELTRACKKLMNKFNRTWNIECEDTMFIRENDVMSIEDIASTISSLAGQEYDGKDQNGNEVKKKLTPITRLMIFWRLMDENIIDRGDYASLCAITDTYQEDVNQIKYLIKSEKISGFTWYDVKTKGDSLEKKREEMYYQLYDDTYNSFTDSVVGKITDQYRDNTNYEKDDAERATEKKNSR